MTDHQRNSFKLCNGFKESQSKPRQQRDQNFSMEENSLYKSGRAGLGKSQSGIQVGKLTL